MAASWRGTLVFVASASLALALVIGFRGERTPLQEVWNPAAKSPIVLESLHQASLVKRSSQRIQELAQVQAITIPPSGYVVRQGKRIHAILDVAAPLDASTGAAVPGIVSLQQTSQEADSQPQQATSQQLADLQGSYSATASAMAAARKGARTVSQLRNARQQQLAEEDEEQPPVMEEDQDMFPPTEAQQYAIQEPEGEPPVTFTAPPPQQAQAAYAYPPAVATAAPSPVPEPLVHKLPNYFVAPFQRWSDEDAAQHAYNLAQWRVHILQAKVKQAELHKELVNLANTQSTRHVEPRGRTQRVSSLQAAGGAGGAGSGAEGNQGEGGYGGMEKLRKETAEQLKDIERQMLTLAKATERAIHRGREDTPRPRSRRSRDPRPSRHEREGGHGFRSKTQKEMSALKAKLALLQKQVRERADPLEDAIAHPALKGGVPAQVALWQRISKDVQA